MKPLVGGVLALVSVLAWSTTALAAGPDAEGAQAATRSIVRGRVSDSEKSPVSEVDVILLSERGAEIARTSTDAVGTYSLGCVDVGPYQYRIIPRRNGYKGHTVVAPLGPNGLTIVWAVDHDKPALASATANGGPCGGAGATAIGGAAAAAAGATGAPVGAGGTAAVIAGGAAVAGGVGVRIAAGMGAFDSNRGGRR